jgi:hypothetical protein
MHTEDGADHFNNTTKTRSKVQFSEKKPSHMMPDLRLVNTLYIAFVEHTSSFNRTQGEEADKY